MFKKYFQNTKLILGLIFLLALVLRLIYLDSTTFFYDQARDAFSAMEIWTKDPIKVAGPPTDFPGVHHGPFYYYLISPVYFFTSGSVTAVKILLILINCLTIFLVFSICKNLFKDRRIAFLAAFLFAISFELTQYARWISHPGIALFTISLGYWSVIKLVQDKKWALITLFLAYGLSIQLEFFLIYLALPYALSYFVLRGSFSIPRFNLKTIILASLVLFATLLTFILAEIRFNFQGFLVLLEFGRQQSGFGINFTEKLLPQFNRLANVYFYSVWGINLFLAGVLSIVLISWSLYHGIKKQNKNLLFLSIWALAFTTLGFFRGTEAYFVTVGSSISVIILTAYFLVTYLGKIKAKWVLPVVLGLIIFGNLNLILTKNKHGEVLFTVQDKMLIADEKKVVDWIYQKADGQPFRLNTFTNPLFINTTWALMFNWHGRSTYGYMPYWWGEPQVNVPGSDVKFSDNSNATKHFVIIEPLPTSDTYFMEAFLRLEDTRSKTVETTKIGTFTIYMREVTSERTFNNADVFYQVKLDGEKKKPTESSSSAVPVE